MASRATLWAGLLAVVVLAAVGSAVALSQRLPQGPVPIAYDREACRHCHMQIGEPGFAAQVQLKDGEVLDFDDPGCLLEWLRREQLEPGSPRVHALWFHHLREDRWLGASQVGFVKVAQTPMGWGLGAVDAAQPGAIGLAEASMSLARRDAERALSPRGEAAGGEAARGEVARGEAGGGAAHGELPRGEAEHGELLPGAGVQETGAAGQSLQEEAGDAR